MIVVNGISFDRPEDDRLTLLEFLRDHLGLHGTKFGCRQGGCGACTVLLDGRTRIMSCLALAAQYDDCAITTIEGLGSPDQMHPLQSAFIERDGFQCGYCTPGQICSALGMIYEARRGSPDVQMKDLKVTEFSLTPDQIRERMTGNLCRCGAYNGIVAAIQQVQGELPA